MCVCVCAHVCLMLAYTLGVDSCILSRWVRQRDSPTLEVISHTESHNVAVLCNASAHVGECVCVCTAWMSACACNVAFCIFLRDLNDALVKNWWRGPESQRKSGILEWMLLALSVSFDQEISASEMKWFLTLKILTLSSKSTLTSANRL